MEAIALQSDRKPFNPSILHIVEGRSSLISAKVFHLIIITADVMIISSITLVVCFVSSSVGLCTTLNGINKLPNFA
uniref:Uncharacterized protein n=1 Tax=Glossina pallidipes TaxID=7398 RepID=A0A1A9Z5G7_GLOPL